MKTKTDKVIEFKSDTPNYYPEESGDKSNTVRIVNYLDDRKIVLDNMLKTKKYGKIKIIHKQILSECFIRDISNVTYFNGVFIISWKALKKLEHSGKSKISEVSLRETEQDEEIKRLNDYIKLSKDVAIHKKLEKDNWELKTKLKEKDDVVEEKHPSHFFSG